MNLALLGDNPACLPLVRSIAVAPQHRLCAAAESGDFGVNLAALLPGLRVLGSWQELLTDAALEAVIVCGASPAVVSGMRQLAAAGKSLIVIPDVRLGAAVAYELLLPAEEGTARLVPAFPHRFQTIYRALRQEIESGQLGAVSYVQLEHTVAGKTVVPQEHIDELLLADADLLRWLGGEYQQVTALQAGATADGAAVATVTLAGDDLPTATWSARGGEVGGFRLTVAGSERTAVLESRAGEERLLVDGIPVATGSGSAADGRGIVAAIGARAGEYEHRPRFSRDQRADARRSLGQAGREGDSEIGTAPRWSDLVRAFDVVDAARRSLRRRRTIVLSAEDASERSQFKTQMTAIGCGVLTWTLVGVVLTLLAGAVLDPRDSEQRRAESAGFVVRADDFEPETAQLTAGGAEHVKDIVPRLRHASSAVVVEQGESGAETPLDARRRGTVVAALVRDGATGAEQRTIVRPLRGRVFRALIIAAWCAVFAPLVLYLAAQALIVLARPRRGGGP